MKNIAVHVQVCAGVGFCLGRGSTSGHFPLARMFLTVSPRLRPGLSARAQVFDVARCCCAVCSNSHDLEHGTPRRGTRDVTCSEYG